MTRKDSLDSTVSESVRAPGSRVLPPILGRLFTGTFWLALRVPLQVVFALWTTRLIVEAIGQDQNGAYKFAWGFGFFQFLFEFGASSALQRQISDAWTRGDRDAVDRSIACGMTFYTLVAVLQMAALLAVGYWALPNTAWTGRVVRPDREDLVASDSRRRPATGIRSSSRACCRPPGGTISCRGSSSSARSCGSSFCSWDSSPDFDFFLVIVAQMVLQIGIGFIPGLLGDDSRAGASASFPRCASGRLQAALELQFLHRAHPDQRRAGRQDRYDDSGLHPRRSGTGQYGL